MFNSSGFWPPAASHGLPTGQWEAYRKANEIFTEAILSVYEDDDYAAQSGLYATFSAWCGAGRRVEPGVGGGGRFLRRVPLCGREGGRFQVSNKSGCHPPSQVNVSQFCHVQ